MDIWQETYASNPDLYESLVVYEDYQGNVISTLTELISFESKRVVEFGAGTGRVTRLVAPLAGSIVAFDQATPMLSTAHKVLADTPNTNWRLAAGDNREMPVATNTADITIQGWSFGHLMSWIGAGWEAHVERAVDEMDRITRPKGLLLMLETLGTGGEALTPPEPLMPYYTFIESLGFQRRPFRTDYLFPSLELAERGMTPFFGPDVLAEAKVGEDGSVIVPEWTGLWWKAAKNN